MTEDGYWDGESKYRYWTDEESETFEDPFYEQSAPRYTSDKWIEPVLETRGMLRYNTTAPSSGPMNGTVVKHEDSNTHLKYTQTFYNGSDIWDYETKLSMPLTNQRLVAALVAAAPPYRTQDGGDGSGSPSLRNGAIGVSRYRGPLGTVGDGDETYSVAWRSYDPEYNYYFGFGQCRYWWENNDPKETAPITWAEMFYPDDQTRPPALLAIRTWDPKTGPFSEKRPIVPTSLSTPTKEENGTYKIVLLPVEIYDDAINSPTIAWNGETITLVQIQAQPAIIPDALIQEGRTAYSRPHRGTGNGGDEPNPDMPRLVARLRNGPAGVQVQWRMRVTYDRGNGARVARNQAEDTVMIPPANAQGQPGWSAAIGADQEWRIFESAEWQQEIAQRGFFGGQATVYCRIGNAAEQRVAGFRIGGHNPDPARCRRWIETRPDAGPAGNLWFAYAVAKSESQDYNGPGSRYNQFLLAPNHPRDDGLPLWGNDGGTTPGGYGMFQVTGTAADSTANIPRRQIWNWQDNADAGLAILRSKRQTADTWMQQQRNANNANGVALPAHTVRAVTFTEGTNRNMNNAVTIKAYNGASRGRDGFVDNGNVPGFRLDPQGAGHYCFWRNASNEWTLSRFNSPADQQIQPFNYVDRVCSEVEAP